MAEEVGVEPTRHFISASLVLKTRRPTGDIALPYSRSLMLLGKLLFGKGCIDYYPLFTPPLGETQGVEVL